MKDATSRMQAEAGYPERDMAAEAYEGMDALERAEAHDRDRQREGEALQAKQAEILRELPYATLDEEDVDELVDLAACGEHEQVAATLGLEAEVHMLAGNARKAAAIDDAATHLESLR